LIDNEALVDEPSPAFINVDAPDFSTWTPSSNNGAYYVFGETSNNCSTVFVTAENSDAGILDNYALESYEYGDVSFKYGIKKEFNNLGGGLNTYTFTAYCNDGQPVEDSFSATFTETEYNDSYNYNSSLSNDNYYTNVDGNSVHSPAYSSSVPSGASARCKDGTYSFSQNRSGTCSGHGGVSSWL